MGKRLAELKKTVFGLDNPVMRTSERILDLLTLNLLFILSCLPILTIGIAKMALYQVLLELKEEGRIGVTTTYVHALKKHFRQGLSLGIIEVLIMGICLLDLILLSGQKLIILQGLRLICLAILFLTTMTFFYLYPLAVKKTQPVKEHLKQAFFLAGLNFPRSFLMLGIIIGIFLILTSSVMSFLLGLTAILLFGFSGLGFIYMNWIEKILEKYPQLFLEIQKF